MPNLQKRPEGSIPKRPNKKVNNNNIPVDDEYFKDVDYSGSVESAAEQEKEVIKKVFRDNIKKNNDRFKKETDTQYYFTVVCQSREECIKWLKDHKLGNYGMDIPLRIFNQRVK